MDERSGVVFGKKCTYRLLSLNIIFSVKLAPFSVEDLAVVILVDGLPLPKLVDAVRIIFTLYSTK